MKTLQSFLHPHPNVPFFLQNSFLAILMLISGKVVQRLVQRRGISEKCGFCKSANKLRGFPRISKLDVGGGTVARF